MQLQIFELQEVSQRRDVCHVTRQLCTAVQLEVLPPVAELVGATGTYTCSVSCITKTLQFSSAASMLQKLFPVHVGQLCSRRAADSWLVGGTRVKGEKTRESHSLRSVLCARTPQSRLLKKPVYACAALRNEAHAVVTFTITIGTAVSEICVATKNWSCILSRIRDPHPDPVLVQFLYVPCSPTYTTLLKNLILQIPSFILKPSGVFVESHASYHVSLQNFRTCQRSEVSEAVAECSLSLDKSCKRWGLRAPGRMRDPPMEPSTDETLGCQISPLHCTAPDLTGLY